MMKLFLRPFSLFRSQIQEEKLSVTGEGMFISIG